MTKTAAFDPKTIPGYGTVARSNPSKEQQGYLVARVDDFSKDGKPVERLTFHTGAVVTMPAQHETSFGDLLIGGEYLTRWENGIFSIEELSAPAVADEEMSL